MTVIVIICIDSHQIAIIRQQYRYIKGLAARRPEARHKDKRGHLYDMREHVGDG